MSTINFADSNPTNLLLLGLRLRKLTSMLCPVASTQQFPASYLADLINKPSSDEELKELSDVFNARDKVSQVREVMLERDNTQLGLIKGKEERAEFVNNVVSRPQVDKDYLAELVSRVHPEAFNKGTKQDNKELLIDVKSNRFTKLIQKFDKSKLTSNDFPTEEDKFTKGNLEHLCRHLKIKTATDEETMKQNLINKVEEGTKAEPKSPKQKSPAKARAPRKKKSSSSAKTKKTPKKSPKKSKMPNLEKDVEGDAESDAESVFSDEEEAAAVIA